MEHLRALHAAGGQAVILSRQVPRLKELWAEEIQTHSLDWSPGLRRRQPVRRLGLYPAFRRYPALAAHPGIF